MGRPVKKSRFGNSAGDFEVTGAFSTESIQPDGSGAEAVSTASGNYIVAQRSSTRQKAKWAMGVSPSLWKRVLDSHL